MPGWMDSHFAAGFSVGLLCAAIIYALDWFWHVKIRPRRDERKHLHESKGKDNTLTGKLYERDRERHPEEYEATPPSSPPHPSLSSPDATATAAIQEQREPVTSDLPATEEHPAPRTAMIDLRQAPPPRPLPPLPTPVYTGPERRLRSDNPYPELRRRAEDRERQEAEDAARPTPPPPSQPPRMTRAEERRLREAGATVSEQPNTESE